MTQEEFINLLIKIETPKDKITIENGLINVDGDVDLSWAQLTKIPHPFGVVTGYFSCSNNYLTTLEGAPKKVGGDFWCDNNKLTNLKGAPLKVGGGFCCVNNKLTTLVELPKEVGGYFVIDYGYLSNYNDVYNINKKIVYLKVNIKF